METAKNQLGNRVLALLLSVMMILALMPFGALTAFAANETYPTSFTFTVKDGETGIKANIDYTVKVNDVDQTPVNQDTGDDGVLAIDLAADYADAFANGDEIKIVYSVTKEGYQSIVNAVAAVTDLAGNVDVAMQAEVPTTAQVTVSVTGDATVKLNDVEQNSVTVEKDETVKVEIIPGEGSYLKTVTVAGENKEVTKGNAYEETLTVTENVAITAVSAKEYTVTATAGEGGSIKLNDDTTSPITVDDGTSVTVNVVPDEGYHISSVTIDTAAQTITDVSAFSKDLVITGNTTVEATFVKVYTITVTHNENGTVVTDPESVGGSVTVNTGTEVSVTATPNTNYRVSEVKINGVTDSTVLGVNNEGYNYSFSADKNYEFEITFALNRFSVTAQNAENGTIAISESPVDYGTSSTITLSPNPGYTVESVKVNGTEVACTTDELTYVIENITTDQEVIATFKMTAIASMSDVSFNYADALRANTDGTYYVFAKDANVVFNTGKDGIKITFSDNSTIGGKNTKSVTITETKTIKKIELRYKADGEWTRDWHEVPTISASNTLKVVVDKEVSKPVVTPDAANANGYYNSDVNVSVTALDPGDYSGIAKVEYWIENGSETTKPVTNLYEYEDGSEIKSSYTGAFTVDAEANNADGIKVYVRVTDRAGNTEIETVELNIYTTPPEISVSIDGTLHTEATAGYYNGKRTATITYIVRDTCFDETAATNGINITATDIKGNAVTISKAAMISWNHSGDTHQATITFDTDAHYVWSVEYTNKADKSNEGIKQEIGDSIYDFTVDKVAPNGTVTVETDTWNDIVSVLTFGLWKNYSVTATATISDSTSSTYDIQYYKANDNAILSEDELDSLFENGKFGTDEITVASDEKFVVYVRLTDYAGNTKYISTNGIIYDKTEGEITLTPDRAPNENGFYNADVTFGVRVNENVNDVLAYSGIKTIDYEVKNGSTITQSGNLYTFDANDPTYEQLKDVWEKTDAITVDSQMNNSDNVTVTVKVVDNAGNPYEETTPPFAINTSELTASIEFDGEPVTDVDGHGYYGLPRTATLTVYDRASSFDETAAKDGFVVVAKDAKNNDVSNAFEFKSYEDENGDIHYWRNDGDVHTATISFNEDANIEWSYSYTNKADNALGSVTKIGKTPDEFTVDTEAPTGSVSIKNNIWHDILSVITFGLYNKNTVEVDATSDDETSPYTVEYYKLNSEAEVLEVNGLSDTELVEYLNGKTFKTFSNFSVEEDELFVVYLKLTDYAGNVRYINSDGYVVDLTPSTITIKAKETKDPKQPVNGIYNDDVTVAIEVKDAAPFSGIKTIDYKVIKDNDTENPTQSGNLYTTTHVPGNKETYPDYNTLKSTSEWSGEIVVDAEKNNSSNVKVVVTTEDNAGNIKEEYISLDIDATAPTIAISYDNNKDNNGNTYFDADRTATIVITERANHFDAGKATEGIVITAVDVKGNAIENAYTISTWALEDNETDPDKATHTATVHFAADANYTFAISYTDEADNVATDISTGSSVAPYKFTVDTVAPTGSVTATSAEGRETEWKELVNDLTFGFWSKQKITVTGTSDDVTSPIAAVDYYKVSATKANDGTTALTSTDLDAISAWKTFTSLDIVANEQFTVYIRITDNAGNYTYISTDGLIVDDQAPLEETIAPEITINPEQPINGLYNSDVKVDIKVVDPLVGGTYSGLKTITYKVLNLGEETQSGTLYSFDNGSPRQSDLLQTWTGEITVDSTKNNSNDVVIEIYAEDNSLNSSKDKVSIKIDITAPQIDISYDNNAADSNTYFKANRTATIVVTERNFKADDIKITLTNTDGVIPALSDWTKQDGTGNEDDTTWTATILYSADGDYVFDIAYTDLANNVCPGANYGESVAPQEFTIDQTIPVIAVSYDNNDALNTNYYKADRTATIVITEHNFSTDRIVITVNATDDGAATTVPTETAWTTNGDTHTATIHYAGDALYTFDIAYTDLAGNEAADYAQDTFYVDKTAPTLDITGVADKSANNGTVAPVITYSDTNFDANEVTITLTGVNNGKVDYNTSKAEIHNGQTITYADFEKVKKVDDLYTLTVKLTDKAGNETTKTINFSANRFGSVYDLTAVNDILNKYLQTEEDIVFTETNVDTLERGTIKIVLTKNGAPQDLVEGSDYSVVETGGDGEWSQYKYTINKSLFSNDGRYSVSIYSVDAAGNVNENIDESKEAEISFGIDKTAPVIIPIDFESGVQYAVEVKTVSIEVKDNLVLENVKIYLNGKEVEYKVDGETYTFDIPEQNSTQDVRIVATDAAGNEFEVNVEKFLVSTNLFVRWYNNTPLFVGSLIGVGALGIGGTALGVFGKKKKKLAKGA